ncbi:hypothetical protein BGX21_002307 [Mortierella sp. AD011]|nr:hypothetical protein BGX20_009114 [Mortierella sp. AD010]KAF9403580.1 hypothetical protein BGX21_002307 [Mortierella sp. AD011]
MPRSPTTKGENDVCSSRTGCRREGSVPKSFAETTEPTELENRQQASFDDGVRIYYSEDKFMEDEEYIGENKEELASGLGRLAPDVIQAEARGIPFYSFFTG